MIRRGENHPRAKLTEADIPVIREECQKGRGSIARLARRYGMDESTFRGIRDGYYWKHVP